MREVFMLSRAQLNRMKRYFPTPHGVKRVDDRRVISGIISVSKNGLRWKDAPSVSGPYKTLYNQFVRWSLAGLVNVIFRELAKSADPRQGVMIDATHLKAHRTAASLRQKGHSPAVLVARTAA